MTSKVALQVDRLASSLVDESIETIEVDSQPGREQQQKQKQQLEQREHQHKANSTSPSQSLSGPTPITLLTSSSASSSSSSSQDLIDTVDNNNEAGLQDQHQNREQRDHHQKKNRKNQSAPEASGSSPKSLSETTTTTTTSCGIKAKKRKMGNNVHFLNDSGIPMDGVELDSPSVTRSGIISPLQLASSTNSTINSAASSTATLNNQTNNRNSKATNNEAIASDSPTLSFGDDSKSSANYAYEFDIATKELQFQSGSVGSNVGAGPGEALEGGTNRNTDESFQNLQSDKNQTNHQTNSVRSFGDLFDDDDLD